MKKPEKKMDKPAKRVAAIIVTYNGMDWLHRCIASLMNSEVPVDIYVTDNASQDGTQNVIRSVYTEINLISSAKNLGFAAGNNVSIARAMQEGYDYYFLLNQDAWTEREALGELTKVADAHPEFGIVSPMHLNGKGSSLDLLFSANIDPDSCPGFLSDLYLGKTKNFYLIRNVNAAAWLVRHELFEKAGLFDPLFHMYGEDENFIHRAHYHGFESAIVPGARIYHDRENRALKPRDENMDMKDQMSRMQVIILNPKLSLTQRLLHLFRKSMSDAIQNLFKGRFIKFYENMSVLIRGFFSSFRYRNRHIELQAPDLNHYLKEVNRSATKNDRITNHRNRG